MRKRFLIVIMAAVLLMACGDKKDENKANSSNDNTPAVSNEAKNDKNVSDEIDNTENSVDETEPSDSLDTEATVADKYFETKGYLYKNGFDENEYFYVVKNITDKALTITGYATAYDTNGSELGNDKDIIKVLGAGETSILRFRFEEENVSKVDCILDYEESTTYQPVISNINFEQSINDSNVTVTATNTGNIDAQYVFAHILFLDKNDNLVDYTYLNFPDVLRPGESFTDQATTYKEFDHYLCIGEGQSNGESTEASSEVSEKEFDIKTYLYEENTFGNTYYYVIMKNNSDKTVEITVEGLAYDTEGKVIGADSGDIDVLAPGEQSIVVLFMDSVTGVDHVECTYAFNTEPMYKAGLANIKTTIEQQEKTVIIYATNEGEEAIEDFEAHILQFDEKGNICGEAIQSLEKTNLELKPGETVIKPVELYGEFSNIEVYYTGRVRG